MRTDKILAIAAFLSLIAALCVVVVSPPVASYETSIYDAYPWHFWLAVCFTISCGVLIVLRQALTKAGSNWWLVGLAAIVMANSVVLLLPFLHGYLVYGRDDPLSHLLAVKDTISAGGIMPGDYYPASRILAASLSTVCGVDPSVVVNCLPAFFSVVYVLGVCSLAVVVGKNRGQVLLISALGTVLLFSNFGSMFLPTHFAFAVVPLILFLLYLRMSGTATSVVFVVLLLLVPIFHVFASVTIAAVFLLFELCLALWNRLNRQSGIPDGIRSAPPAPRQAGSVTAAMLVLVAGLAWYWNFAAFGANARSLRDFVLQGIGQRPADTIASTATQADLSIFEFIQMFIRGYGHELLYSVMAVIGILVIMRRVWLTRRAVTADEVFFCLLFVVFSLAFFPFLFGSFLFLNPLREFEWALMAATVVIGMVFYEGIFPQQTETEWRLGRKTGFVILALVLVVSSIIGVFGAYYSPLSGLANPQVTRAEMSGMQWFVAHSSSADAPAINLHYIGSLAWRALGAHANSRIVIDTKRVAVWEAPPHFDYQQESTSAPDLSSGGYLVVTTYDRLQSSEVWDERGDFTTQDFNRLVNDPTLARVYCNGGFEIWLGLSS